VNLWPRRHQLPALLLLAALAPSARPLHAETDDTGPHVGRALRRGVTAPLRLLPSGPVTRRTKAPDEPREIPIRRLHRDGAAHRPRNAERESVSRAPREPLPPPVLTFEGISNQDNFETSDFILIPPDPNGDVGPHHYVETVNILYRAYDKNTGAPLMPPLHMSQIFAGLGGACAEIDAGDPIVLYDHLADRWLLSQLANSPHQCVAISQTGDPTGSFYVYDFPMPNTKFNDYPKLGVWPDAYYMTDNQFSGGFRGVGVFAFDRVKMLAGRADATYVYFDLEARDPSLAGMLPADLDGPPPPAGTPNYFLGMTSTHFGNPIDGLRIFEFHADFESPQSSTFVERQESALAVAAFDPVLCDGVRHCLPQPGTTNRLEVLWDRLMYRLQYRNFGAYESLVVTHDVDADGQDRSGVRWYELRRPLPTGSFEVAQQATFAPGDVSRFMSSAAQDASGNLAVGYSVTSATTFPSIRYAARRATDPPGELPLGEGTLMAGAGSQTDGDRWGDYSMMAVDPSGCGFYYVNEYYTATAACPMAAGLCWHTRIGHFDLGPGTCVPESTGRLSGTVTDAASGLPIPGAAVLLSGGYFGSTDAEGHYTLDVPPGDYDLEASAHGYRSTSVVGVAVTTGGQATQDLALTAVPILVHRGFHVDDHALGNGNGQIDAGEAFTLAVELANDGPGAATAVVATLTTDSDGVTIVTPNVSYPDLAPHASGVAAFQLETDPGFAAGLDVRLSLQVETALGSFTFPITLLTGSMPREYTYVVNPDSAAIEGYRINPVTGSLTALPSVAVKPYPWLVAIDPSNRFLYTGSHTDRLISGFRIAPETGELTPVPPSPLSWDYSLKALAVHPSGRFLYAAATDHAGWLLGYQIDQSTGALTRVPGSPFGAGGYDPAVAITPEGRFLYAVTRSLGGGRASLLAYRINPATGVLTRVGVPIDAGRDAYSMTTEASGQFVYTLDNTIPSISGFRIGADGRLTPLASSPLILDHWTGRLVSPVPGRLYVAQADFPAVMVAAFHIDLATGALTSLPGSPYDATHSGEYFAFEGSGNFAYSNGASGVAGFRVASDGSLTHLPDSPFPGDGYRYQIAATHFNPQLPVKAELKTPTPGTTLTSVAVSFEWTQAVDPQEYRLSIGSRPGAADIDDGSTGLGLSRTVRLPADGRALYVRLWTRTSGAWLSNDYTYTAARIRTVSIQDARVVEGHRGTSLARFVVRLSTPSPTPISVVYQTSDGSAVAGTDYVASSGSVSFPAGAVTQVLTVPVIGDTLDEPNESFLLILSAPTNVELGRSQATATILDDDVGGVVSIAPLRVLVGEKAGSARVAVTRSGGLASGVSVEYSTADGTATAGADYGAASGTLNFGAGETVKVVTIPIQDDSVAEGNETFGLALAAPVGGAHLGARPAVAITIVDDERAVQFSVAASPAQERSRQALLRVDRTGPLTGAVDVDFTTADGTASAGADYVARSGTLHFPAGVPTALVRVVLIDDSVAEPDETFTVTLSTPRGAALGPRGATLVTIRNDDGARP
jgi:6-phosphogluconolactonase (cycloisomerase 2 family)